MIVTVPFDPSELEFESESTTRLRNDSFEWGDEPLSVVRNDDYSLDPEFEPYTPTGGRLDRFTAEYDDLPVHVTRLESGVLFGKEFLVFDGKHPTVSKERLYCVGQKSALRRLDLEQLNVDKGVTYLVGANAQHLNFYHWFFQCLTGLVLMSKIARERGMDYRIVLPPIDALRKHSLELAGIPESECITLEPHCFLQDVPLLYTTATYGNHAFQPSPKLIDLLNPFRDECLKRSKAVLPTHFYVSRRDIPNRRSVENEDELAEALQAHGYEEVFMASLPLVDQVAAFTRAESIVGLHGAALANLMFSPCTARFIEILPENYRMAYFFRLSQVRGMGYSQVLSREAAGWDGADIHKCPAWVDVSKVLKAIDQSEAVRLQRAA